MSTLKTISNEELLNTLGEELATGQPVIFHMEKSSNEDVTMLYLAQTKTSEATGIDALFMGWNNEQTVRCIRSINTNLIGELAKQLNCEIAPGKVLPAEMSIQVTENFEQGYDTQTAKIYPKSHKKAGDTIEFLGRPVYRHTSLVFTKDLNDTYVRSTEDAQALVDAEEAKAKATV
jgi:hypothetical protein